MAASEKSMAGGSSSLKQKDWLCVCCLQSRLCLIDPVVRESWMTVYPCVAESRQGWRVGGLEKGEGGSFFKKQHVPPGDEMFSLSGLE